jgi:hypothetical protein
LFLIPKEKRFLKKRQEILEILGKITELENAPSLLKKEAQKIVDYVENSEAWENEKTVEIKVG